MKRSELDQLPDDLSDVARRLQRERPRASADLLHRVKMRALSTSSPPWASASSGVLRTRVAITATLAVGVLLTGSSAALAVSGLYDNDRAAVSQYNRTPPPATTPGGGGGGNQPAGPEQPASEVETLDESGGGGVVGLNQPRQVAASDRASLPFTGLAAIPLLLAGLGLLATGFVLMRRSELPNV